MRKGTIMEQNQNNNVKLIAVGCFCAGVYVGGRLYKAALRKVLVDAARKTLKEDFNEQETATVSRFMKTVTSKIK